MANAISKDAIEAVRKNARVFQSIIDIAEAMDGVNSIEQAATEANARLAAAKDEESALAASVLSINADIKALTSKKAEYVLRAQDFIDAANAQATQIVEEAKAQAKTMAQKANAKADGIIADASARATEVDAATAAAKQVLTDTLAAIENASKERSSLQKAIDSLRAKFS